MNKKGINDSWYFSLGTALIFLGAWLYGEYESNINLLGIVLIAIGIGLIASRLK